MNIQLHKNKRDAGQATDIPVINTILHEYTLHKLLGSLTSQHSVDQVRSRTSTCDSIAIHFESVLKHLNTITSTKYIVNIFTTFFLNYTFVISNVDKVSYACSLSLFALHLIEPHNTCVLGVAPLFVVLREESVERNRVPRQQINWEQNQI